LKGEEGSPDLKDMERVKADEKSSDHTLTKERDIKERKTQPQIGIHLK